MHIANASPRANDTVEEAVGASPKGQASCLTSDEICMALCLAKSEFESLHIEIIFLCRIYLLSVICLIIPHPERLPGIAIWAKT